MLGIHVWRKSKNTKYDDIMLGVCLLSILSWKKFQGPIKLYTNHNYLDDLKKWKLDQYYDSISILEDPSEEINQKTYWAWDKILVANKNKPPFVMVDNDLWISKKLNFDNNFELVGYHFENFDDSVDNSTYPKFKEKVPDSMKFRWNEKILPINCALCFINNEKLLTEWFSSAKEIAKRNPLPWNENLSSNMCFIEQRLLPMITDELGMKTKSLIQHKYNSQLLGVLNGSEWTPPAYEWDSQLKEEFSSISHIWGLKNYLELDSLRTVIVELIFGELSKYEEANNHQDLILRINELL